MTVHPTAVQDTTLICRDVPAETKLAYIRRASLLGLNSFDLGRCDLGDWTEQIPEGVKAAITIAAWGKELPHFLPGRLQEIRVVMLSRENDALYRLREQGLEVSLVVQDAPHANRLHLCRVLRLAIESRVHRVSLEQTREFSRGADIVEMLGFVRNYLDRNSNSFIELEFSPKRGTIGLPAVLRRGFEVGLQRVRCGGTLLQNLLNTPHYRSLLDDIRGQELVLVG